MRSRLNHHPYTVPGKTPPNIGRVHSRPTDHHRMLQVLSYSTQQPQNGARSAGTRLTDQLMSGNMMQYGWGGSRMEQPDPNAVLCQVPGCGFDLTESPYYYKRHRVCEGHMKAKTVALDGDVCRFCQQCGRFQPLTDFNGERRSCDAALKAHNARRRQINAASDATVFVTDRRGMRGGGSSGSSSRRSQPQESTPEDTSPVEDSVPSERVCRRLGASRSRSFRSAQELQQQRGRDRVLAAAGTRATFSDGDIQQSRRSNSYSPSAISIRSDLQQGAVGHFGPYQQQQQQFGDGSMLVDRARSAPACRSVSPPDVATAAAAAAAAAADGCFAGFMGDGPASRAWSGSSASTAADMAQQMPQPGRYQLTGGLSSGRSRLAAASAGMAYSMPPAAAPYPGTLMPHTVDGPEALLQQHQQQLCSTNSMPAVGVCAGMDCFPAQGLQQATLASWMSQPSSAQELQQLWAAATTTVDPRAAAAGVSPAAHQSVSGSMQGPAAGLPLHPQRQQLSSVLRAYFEERCQQQPDQQQSSVPMPQQPWAAATSALAAAHPAAVASAGLNHRPGKQTPGAAAAAAHAQQQQQPGQQEMDWLDELLALNDTGLHGDGAAAPVPTAGTDGQVAAAASGGSALEGALGPACLPHAPVAAAAATSPTACKKAAAGPAASLTAAAATAGAAAALVPPRSSVTELLDLLLVPDVELTMDMNMTSPPASMAMNVVSPQAGMNMGTKQRRLSDLSKASLGLLPQAGAAAAAAAPGSNAARSIHTAALPGAAAAAEDASMPLSAPLLRMPSSGPAGADAADAGALLSQGSSATAVLLQAGSANSGQGAAVALGLPQQQQQQQQVGTASSAAAAVAPPVVSLADAAANPGLLAAAGDRPAAGRFPRSLPPVTVGQSAVSPLLPDILLPLEPAGPPQQQQPTAVLAEPSLTLLQQEQLLAQHQLEQQQMLQQMHWQQRQQLLQQHNQLQHQLVRLSVKLHGVLPEQLPSSTVQAMQRLILGHAKDLEAIMLQPSFRQGCVQMEFDLLVKPHGPMPPHHAANQPVQEQQGGTAGNSNNKRMQAAGEWSAVVAATSSCPATAAAEAQLRQALPFSLLLDTLLALPLPAGGTSSSSSAGSGSDSQGYPTWVSTSDGDSGIFEAHSDISSPASSSSSTDSSGLLPLLTAAAAAASASSSGMDSSRLASVHVVGSAVRAVYAQIGDSVGIWTATQGLVQDWTPMVATAVGGAEQEHSSAATAAAAAGAGLRPAFITAGPLCSAAGSADGAPAATAAAADGPASALRPLLLDVAIRPGSSSSSSGVDSPDVQLSCISRGAFVPLASRPAPAAVGAGVIGCEVLLGLQEGRCPGLLTLQAEQPVSLDELLGSSSRDGGAADIIALAGDASSLQATSPQADPVPVKSSPVRALVCPSHQMAAELSAVLLGAVSAGRAASLLQQLGLLLDFWGLQQHQQEAEPGPRSELEEWTCGLLENQRYLRVIRAACGFWLLFAVLHDMPATVGCLRSIWNSLGSKPVAAAAVAAAEDPGSSVTAEAAAAASSSVALKPARVDSKAEPNADASGGAPRRRPAGRPIAGNGYVLKVIFRVAAVLLMPLLLVLIFKMAAAAHAGESLTQRLRLLMTGLREVLQALLLPLVVLVAAAVAAFKAIQQQDDAVSW